jgi:hypothetical protein
MPEVNVVDLKPLSVSTHQAAQLLSISPRKLFDLTAPRGPIRVVKVGRSNRYAVEELQRFLREHMGDIE